MSPSRSSDRPRLAASGALVTLWLGAALYGAHAVAILTGRVPRGIVNDLLFVLVYGTAGVAGLRAAAIRSDDPRVARGWRLVGLAWLASALGCGAWATAYVFPAEPLSVAGTILYNLYYPLVVIGLLHFLVLPAPGLPRIRLVIESLIAGAATAALAWYFVFRLDNDVTGLGLVEKIGALFVGELLIVLGAAAVLHRPPRAGYGGWLTLFSLGTFSAVVADFLYEHDRLIVSRWTGPVGDMLLVLGASLVASAALVIRPHSEPTRHHRFLRVGLTALPYVAVTLVGTLLAVEFIRSPLDTGPIPGLVIGGLVLLLLVIGRLLIAQREFSAEAVAREAQSARFRSLVQRSSDAILVVGHCGTIEYASPAFARMVDEATPALPGRRLGEFVEPAQRERLETWLRAPGTPERWRFRHAGEFIDVEAVGTDLTTDPAVRGVVVNARNVTERLRLETQLRQAQKLEVVGRLASSVAHDFNNVLTVVLGNARLAQLAAVDEVSSDEDLEAITSAAERGAALSRQLLSLSRPTVPNPRNLDLCEVVAGMERTLRAVLPSSNTVSVQVSDQPVPVRLDDVQVEQILLNLALNARDAMPEGGRIDIDVGNAVAPDALFGDLDLAAGTWARVRVRDSGAGMSAETLARAFEPFFTTKSQSLGTGLGLSTVRNIAREAGGDVAILSRPGHGTTVTLFLPLHATEGSAAAVATIGELPPAHGRVLIVEDEKGVRRLLARYLERIGYEIDEAADGVAALEHLHGINWRIDLVLTDLVMPRMGGLELTRHIRQTRPGLPVLCMSGTPGALEVGNEPWAADRVIAKPMELEQVASRVAEALATAV